MVPGSCDWTSKTVIKWVTNINNVFITAWQGSAERGTLPSFPSKGKDWH